MKAVVEMKDLTVRYGTREAVHSLSLEVAQGEVLGILGPNGSGKTSLLSAAEGLLHPAQGSVRVHGMDPAVHRERVYQQMGVQLQEAHYPMRIRVGELCSLFAAFHKSSVDWRASLAAYGLAGLAKRSVHTLSGGERQRLSMALALLGTPSLLIFDEISTGLDPHARLQVQHGLRRTANAGAAMLIVTHYPNELKDLADRILVLEKGREVFCGPPGAFMEYARAAAVRRLDTLEDAYLAVCARDEETLQ